MVNKIVNAILRFMVSNGIIKEQEISVYRYGYTLLFEKGVNIIIALVICVCTNKWLEIWVFLGSIITLRSYTGGWHARKFWQCTLMSNAMIILMLYIISNFKFNIYYYIAIETVIFVIILLIIPVEHPNRSLKEYEIKKYKNISFVVWGVQYIIGFVFYNECELIFQVILVAHIMLIVAAFIQKVGNIRMIKNNK